MEIKKTDIEGLIEFFPRVFRDDRGYFLETFRSSIVKEAGIEQDFVQDNQSFSQKGTLRGLHFQKPPFAQGKLVKVITGKVLDVAVDLRSSSPTYGQYRTFLLDALKHNMVYVPEGFAHGFVALEDSIFAYKCTNIYNKESEAGIIYNDATLNIDWQIDDPIISEKDLILPDFKSARQNL